MKYKFKQFAFTLDELREMAYYDAASGMLIRKKAGHGVTKGRYMGCIKDDGYVAVRIWGRVYYLHRLVWFFHHGVQPDSFIDHVDGNPTNNKIENLRLCDFSTNAMNVAARKNKTVPLKGAYVFKKNGKHYSSIFVNGKAKYLGTFECAEDAHEFYCLAASLVQGKFSYFERPL